MLSLEKRRFREGLITLKGGCSKMGFSFSSHTTSNGMRKNGLCTRRGSGRIREIFFFSAEMVVKHFNGLPRKEVESPSQEVFKND